MSLGAIPPSSETTRPDSVPRLFGTDGIRLVVGREMTPRFVAEVASALAGYLDGRGTVLIARDFRTSSEAMVKILAGTLLMHGVDVRDMGVMPTPCLQFNTQGVAGAMGLTVTASHNPNEFNGIKFTGPQGMEIPREAEEIIERALHYGRYPEAVWEKIGTFRQDPDGVDRYVGSILDHVDVAAIRAWAPTVVLDCGNGTSLMTSPQLLRELGCRVITLNANPDGHFTGRPSEPNEANLADLRKAVVDFGAQLGVAHDGDSDRVAFIDEHGAFVPGEVTLAVFARYRLQQEPGATIVTSVTSSTAVTEVVRDSGGRLAVTKSGSLPVAEGVYEHRGSFAGEENGGYYWPEHQVARDGPMSSAKMLELLARSRRPLSELVAEVPSFHLIKTKVRLAQEALAAREIKPFLVREAGAILEHEAVSLDLRDGVKAVYDDGWLLVRPSGTEPICRVFAESRDRGRAEAILQQGIELVERLLHEWQAEHPETAAATPGA
ncbi:MAG: phosphoglucosamine mutase [Thermoplasmata archaeon]|nr:phosphoglucosamine mutase [Thermoplasmata archaeon]